MTIKSLNIGVFSWPFNFRYASHHKKFIFVTPRFPAKFRVKVKSIFSPY
jgi:hypothetical protein